MKENSTVTRTQSTLQKIFRAINKEVFNCVIDEPMITIQSTKGAYGHVTCSKVWRSEVNGCMDYRHELNIGADTLARPIENVCATMCHEMAHLKAMQDGIKDTSNNGVYHNKKFKEIAENTGLILIDYIPVHGWTVTTPTEKMTELCLKYGFVDFKCCRGLWDITDLFTGFGDDSGAFPSNPPSPVSSHSRTSSTRKYICPICGISCRATKALNLICGDCNARLQLVLK